MIPNPLLLTRNGSHLRSGPPARGRVPTFFVCLGIVVGASLGCFADPASASNCDWYCTDGYCVRCRDHSYPYYALESWETSREFFDSFFGFGNYPDGWSLGCITMTIPEEYVVTIVFRYSNTWSGAAFALYFDGIEIGKTGTVGNNWGSPN